MEEWPFADLLELRPPLASDGAVGKPADSPVLLRRAYAAGWPWRYGCVGVIAARDERWGRAIAEPAGARVGELSPRLPIRGDGA